MELPKKFIPSQIEEKIYQAWEKQRAFAPRPPKDKSKKAQPAFVIALPPPNITGSLHLGHALNNTVQDILIRYHRMKGEEVLWIPGIDHAGIATQTKVEKELKKEGTTRQALGREKFVARVWSWKKKYGNKILDQLKKLGCSLDWDHLTFTLDKDYQEAVYRAFEHYHRKGWIYQGKRVVNWCPRCQSTLSDLEVEHQEQEGTLYYFQYGPVVIATARPETKFRDRIIAVHPADKRYQSLIGKEFEVEWILGRIKARVIADQSIDMSFGTGAMTLTPAHSLVDFELAQKHGLPIEQIIDQQGRLTQAAGQYQGLTVQQARKKVVEILKKKGLVKKIDHHYRHNVSVCYRCGTAVEPLLSRQWFVKMKELKQPAIQVLRAGKINFTPARFQRLCQAWLEKAYDWCISRQLWWGHRLPVWYCQNKKYAGKYQVSKNQPSVCPFCGQCKMKQSEDVLDTWFSSALWTFASLGWGKKNNQLKRYHPTSVLSTARDILFLWVARMIFSSLELIGEIPFHQVYIHPTVLNIKGERMSKSLGTGVDPLEMIDKYGADATRFGLMYQNSGLQDLRFSESNLIAAQKFSNKIWNIARFIFMQLDDHFIIDGPPSAKTAADRRILKRLVAIKKEISEEIEQFQFGQAAHHLYDFIWHDLADHYLEASKEQLRVQALRQNSEKILVFVLMSSLKLLHPFMPFITEEIWQQLFSQGLTNEKQLVTASWEESNY